MIDTLPATPIPTQLQHGITATAEPPAPVTVLRLTGPLSLAEVPTLRTAVHLLLRGPPVTIVIDVTGLVATDEMGLIVLPELTHTARRAGMRLVLAAPSPILRERLQQLGATNLEISETVTGR